MKDVGNTIHWHRTSEIEGNIEVHRNERRFFVSIHNETFDWICAAPFEIRVNVRFFQSFIYSYSFQILPGALSTNTMAELMAVSAFAMAKESNEVKKTKYYHADA